MENHARTFLLVEDDPDDIFIMKRAFRKAGLQDTIQVVTDGQMAVDYLAGKERFGNRDEFPLPDLIFLDLKLPYLNGFEVIEWIRDKAALDDLQIVILSSSSEDRDIRQAHDLGVRSYLVKPPTPEMLLDVLQMVEKTLTESGRL